VLGGDARRRAVRAAEHDRAAHLAAGHVERLGGGVDDVVDRLHGEVEGHELDDRLQARHRRADAEAGEAVLGDRRVDHALRPELLQQALGDLVGALILADLLAHEEHVAVAAHFLGHGVAQRLAHRHGHHLRCPGKSGSLGDGGRGGGRRAAEPLAFLAGCGMAADGRLGCGAGAARGAAARFLALGGDDGDRRVDLHVLGAVGDEDLAEDALVDRLDLHGRLVGLDLGDDVAGLDRVAFLLQPFGERALSIVGESAGIRT
jgi:hypothetical protein